MRRDGKSSETADERDIVGTTDFRDTGKGCENTKTVREQKRK